MERIPGACSLYWIISAVLATFGFAPAKDLRPCRALREYKPFLNQQKINCETFEFASAGEKIERKSLRDNRFTLFINHC